MAQAAGQCKGRAVRIRYMLSSSETSDALAKHSKPRYLLTFFSDVLQVGAGSLHTAHWRVNILPHVHFVHVVQTSEAAFYDQ